MLRSTVTAEQSHSVCHPEAASSLQSAAHSSCKSGRLEKPVVTAVRYNVCVCTRWQNCWTLTPGLYHNELSIVGLIVRREKVKGVKVNQTGRKTESSVIRPFIIWAIHTHTHTKPEENTAEAKWYFYGADFKSVYHTFDIAVTVLGCPQNYTI